MKPTVLYTTSVFSLQSGASCLLLDHAINVNKKGYRVILVLPEDNESWQQLIEVEDAQIKFLPLPRLKVGQSLFFYLKYIFFNIQSIYRLVRLIHERRVSLIHVNEIYDFYGVLASKLTRVPCVWHIRADLAPWPVLQYLFPRVVNWLADAIIVCSKSVAEQMFGKQGIKARNLKVIYDPPSSKFQPGENGCQVRQELAPDNSFIVTLVGKLSWRKGHKTFLHAAVNVLQAFPNAYFVIVGGDLEGAKHEAYALQLRRLPNELGIENRVIFTGFRSDVPQIMSAADIVVHCSIYPDPFPGVVLQAMAIGKAVVASDLGGTKEQIEHGVSGILVPPHDHIALADALCDLLRDEEKRQALGDAAAKRARSEFGFERFFEGLSGIYEQLIVPGNEVGI